MKYFLDTSVLIAIGEGRPTYRKYLDVDAVTLKDNLVEMCSFLLKTYDEKTARVFLASYERIAVDLPVKVIAKAVVFRHRHPKANFSYIDCLGYIYALETKRVFLTGDSAFRGLKRVQIVR